MKCLVEGKKRAGGWMGLEMGVRRKWGVLRRKRTRRNGRNKKRRAKERETGRKRGRERVWQRKKERETQRERERRGLLSESMLRRQLRYTPCSTSLWEKRIQH
jgi:hypothetical protein